MVLNQNYPNPFNSSTIFSYSIPPNLSNQRIKLTIYNINGQKVKRLIDDTLPYGNYMTKWDGTDESGKALPSGTYLCKLEAGNIISARKITLLK